MSHYAQVRAAGVLSYYDKLKDLDECLMRNINRVAHGLLAVDEYRIEKISFHHRTVVDDNMTFDDLIFYFENDEDQHECTYIIHNFDDHLLTRTQQVMTWEEAKRLVSTCWGAV